MFSCNLFLDLRTDFSGGRSGGLVLSSLEEFSTVCCDPHSQPFKELNIESGRCLSSFRYQNHVWLGKWFFKWKLGIPGSSDFNQFTEVCTNIWYVRVLHHVRLSVIPRTAVCQAPLSMEFSRQEYWSGLPFLTPGNISDSGMETELLRLLHWPVDSLQLCHLGSLYLIVLY